MLIEHRGARPVIDDSATIAPGVIISGDVHIGPHTVVLSGAVITSQGAPVRIGERCVIMEQAVIRGAGSHVCIIGDYVLVGPHAHISGATVESQCFIATGATIEAGSVVAIHGIVHIATHCPPGTFVPIGHIAAGNPAHIHPPHEAPAVHKEVGAIGFTKLVFGFESDTLADGTAVKKLCEQYSRALSRHREDKIVEDGS